MKSNAPQVAAKFWADFLRKDFDQDNGDIGQSMLANMTKGMLPEIDSKRVDKFQEYLEESIQQMWDSSSYEFIGVDYHPDLTLSDAAEKAGLGDLFNRLPFKTSMWLDSKANEVKVSVGYRAKSENLEVGWIDENTSGQYFRKSVQKLYNKFLKLKDLVWLTINRLRAS
jgi:hypothetical protein